VVLAEEAIWDELQGLWMFSNGCEYLLGKGTSQNKGSSLQAVRQFSSQCKSNIFVKPSEVKWPKVAAYISKEF